MALCDDAAATKGIDLFYWLEEACCSDFLVDAARLQQILLNFLSNAVKFTSNGCVWLTVRQAPSLAHAHEFCSREEFRNDTTGTVNKYAPLVETSDKHEFNHPTSDHSDPSAWSSLIFEVHDQGVGITSSDLNCLFNSFKQVRNTHRMHGGTGLGLVISKRLAEKMCGRVWCWSCPGKGSTFAFSIQVQKLNHTLSGHKRALNQQSPNSRSQADSDRFKKQKTRSFDFDKDDSVLTSVSDSLSTLSTFAPPPSVHNMCALPPSSCSQLYSAHIVLVSSAQSAGSCTSYTRLLKSYGTNVNSVISLTHLYEYLEHGMQEERKGIGAQSVQLVIIPEAALYAGVSISTPPSAASSSNLKSSSSITDISPLTRTACLTALYRQWQRFGHTRILWLTNRRSAAETSLEALANDVLLDMPAIPQVVSNMATDASLAAIKPSSFATTSTSYSSPRSLPFGYLNRPFNFMHLLETVVTQLQLYQVNSAGLLSTLPQSYESSPDSYHLAPMHISPQTPAPSVLSNSTPTTFTPLPSSMQEKSTELSVRTSVRTMMNEDQESSSMDASITPSFTPTGTAINIISPESTSHHGSSVNLPQAPAVSSRSPHQIECLAAVAPLRILVAEDNLINSRIMCMMLKKLGYTDVQMAINGKICFEMWQQDAREHEPDKRIQVILMDASMDVMDGLESTRLIRGEEHSSPHLYPRTSSPFIIAQTANVSNQFEQRCIEAGMNSYLCKPINLNALINKLQQAYQAWQQQQQQQQQQHAQA